MKLIIKRENLPEHPEHFLRRAGYGFIRDSRRDKESYVRRLGSGFYPRLHMYIEQNGDRIVFDLHLDQKQASYEGARMHNAEHDGEVVEGEIRRLKSLILQKVVAPHPNPLLGKERGQSGELIDKIGGDRNYLKNQFKKEKISWWKKIFG